MNKVTIAVLASVFGGLTAFTIIEIVGIEPHEPPQATSCAVEIIDGGAYVTMPTKKCTEAIFDWCKTSISGPDGRPGDCPPCPAVTGFKDEKVRR